MLEFSVQQFPFRFGLAEGIEPHQVTPGTLLTAENVVWQKSGKVSKRFGTTSLSTSVSGGGSIAAGSRLFARGSELCLVDGTNLYSYSGTTGNWRSVGKVPNVGIVTSTAADTLSGAAECDTAVSSNGLRVDAWVAGVGGVTAAPIYVQVTDTTSGSVVLVPTTAYASSRDCVGVRVLIIGTVAIILSLTNATNISAVTLDLSTLTLSAVTFLRTDSIAVGGSQGWDACVIGTNFVICYTATGTLLKLYSYNTSLVQQATGGITSETNGAHVVSIDGASGEVLYVLYSQGVANPSPVKIAIANPSTLAQTVAPVTIETPVTVTNSTQLGVCRYDSTNCIAAYALQDSTGIRVTSYKISSAAVVSSTSVRGTYGTNMATRPFMLNGACYVALIDYAYTSVSSIPDRSTLLFEIETSVVGYNYAPHRYVGAIDVLIGARNVSGIPLAGISLLSSTTGYLALGFQSSTNTAVTRQGVRIAKLTVGSASPSDLWRTVSSGAEAFISGGVLSAYDGRTAFDYGFTRAPVMYSIAASSSGGSVALGTYLYGATLEYRSATGLLYRSPTQTTAGTVVVSGANNTVTIIAQAYNVGNKQTVSTGFGTLAAMSSIMPWFRSTVGGSNYYRLTVEPTYSTSFVDQSVRNFTFTDRTSDAGGGTGSSGIALASRPLMYTSGGILDDYAPPANVTMALHVDRLWVLASDLRTWWYSKAFQDDLGTAPGFHPNFRIAFADQQVAMASMDDKAVFFSATGIKYMLGTGPAPNGLNTDFQTPTTIQTDVGCTNARSVVSTPDGVMFLSDRGLYLLTRGLELVWIGRPVKDTLAAYPVVTSAVLVAKQNQVRFTCTDAATTVGVTIVYDYVEKQWSTFKHWINGVYGGPIADACMWQGAWTFVGPTGLVFTETTTDYRDASGAYYVPMALETAWITAPASQASPSAGPLKFQSVRELSLHGFSNTDHDLTIQIGFDTEAAYAQTTTFAATSPAVAVGALETCDVTVGTRRKCNAIRFKITDATPSAGSVGTGQGPSFDMMGLEVGIKRGFSNTPATKKG